jgi:hypothetical protein
MALLPDDMSLSGVSYADLLKTATYWAGAVRLSDVPATDVDWLWPGRRKAFWTASGYGSSPIRCAKIGGGEFCATDQFTDEFAQVARK